MPTLRLTVTLILLAQTVPTAAQTPRQWTARDLQVFITVPPGDLPRGVQLSRSPVHLPSPTNPVVTANKQVVQICELFFAQEFDAQLGGRANGAASAVYHEGDVRKEAGILVLVYPSDDEAKRVQEKLGRDATKVIRKGRVLVHVWEAGASRPTVAALVKHVRETKFPPVKSSS